VLWNIGRLLELAKEFLSLLFDSVSIHPERELGGSRMTYNYMQTKELANYKNSGFSFLDGRGNCPNFEPSSPIIAPFVSPFLQPPELLDQVPVPPPPFFHGFNQVRSVLPRQKLCIAEYASHYVVHLRQQLVKLVL
jgi:hypothetical protein